ncbi:MAG TPA: hypothetical protein VFI70_04910 [Nitrososphaeraceae archaeon]|nr:hypothetical protein [Nitrososphaeraceae archaeon]
MKGLKNKHRRSGRPPEVSSEETSIRIRGELSENQSG